MVMTGFTGGCLCGAIRYEVTGEPVRMAICHCDDCRKATGAAFTTNIFVNAADLRVVQGTPKQFQHPTDSGSTMTNEFCANCGSQLFGYSSRGNGVKHVKVGTIDDAGFVRPQIEVYTVRKLPYVRLQDDIPHYERNRPS
jgi:hypothetical protein